MNYYISDLHLGHSKVIEYCNRPFKDVIEMNEYIIEAWNNVVTDNDDVYVIGDISFGKNTLAKYVTRLKGKKYLILGNHDETTLKKAKENILDECFVEITQYKVIKDIGRIVVLFHYPIMDWDRKHYGSYHIHGHIHNRDSEVQSYSSNTNNMLNVSADVIDFTPKTLDQLIDRKIFENVGKMYKREMKRLNLLELISIISESSAEDLCKQFVLYNDNDIKLCTKTYIKEFINSIPEDFDIGNITSNFKEMSGIDINRIRVDLPSGYSFYMANNDTGFYTIKNGLTKDMAYKYFDDNFDSDTISELMIIEDNEVIDHYFK